MHIAIVAPEALPVPPLMGGSVEICIAAIARELAKEHEVTVIGRRHPRLLHKERQGGINYVRVGARSSSAYLKNVIRALRRGTFDVIQVDNRPQYAAAIKAALPQTKVVLFLHSLTFVTPPKLESKKAASLLTKPDLIVANSSSLQRELKRRYAKARVQIRTVPLGVDVVRFRPPSQEEKAAAKGKYGADKAFTLLFVGRVIPRKGIPVMLKAMRHVNRATPRAKLIIAGGGKTAYVSQLKQLAKRLGVTATFTGLLSHRSIHLIYRCADCFVCPSQRHEAFGLVNVEAIATGVPVVASSIGGIGEIVKNGRNGFLVADYKNPAAFGRVIAKLGTRPELLSELSQKARADAVAQFSWSATACKLAGLYCEMDEVSRLSGKKTHSRRLSMKKRAIRFRRYVHSKWAKTTVLKDDDEIGNYVPPTKRLSITSLEELLHKCKMVYVKPSIGSFGNGVIRVELLSHAEQPYRYQLGLEKRRFNTFDDLCRSLLKETGGRPYLVQQGIHLLTYRNNRFDIRVMVQKNCDGHWETTGIIGRVADPRKVVTNVHNGGTLMPAEKLMQRYLPRSRKSAFLQELRELGVRTGKTLIKRYPGLKEIGIDVAVDQDVRPWILEVNTAPDPYIFRKLRDKKVYRKVYRYWKMHQPTRKLKPLSKTFGLGL